jgi:hypothetical protein
MIAGEIFKVLNTTSRSKAGLCIPVDEYHMKVGYAQFLSKYLQFIFLLVESPLTASSPKIMKAWHESRTSVLVMFLLCEIDIFLPRLDSFPVSLNYLTLAISSDGRQSSHDNYSA